MPTTSHKPLQRPTTRYHIWVFILDHVPFLVSSVFLGNCGVPCSIVSIYYSCLTHLKHDHSPVMFHHSSTLQFCGNYINCP